GTLASPGRCFHGQHKESIGEPGALAVHDVVSRPAFSGWSVCRMVAVERRGLLSSYQSKQFFFLCADSDACTARARGARRASACNSQAEQLGTKGVHDGYDRAVLSVEVESWDVR